MTKQEKLKRPKDQTDEELITIKKFAARIDVSYPTAYEMAQSKYFLENGLAVNINIHNNKNGGTRINWTKYLKELEKQEKTPKTNKSLLWDKAV